MKREYLAAYYVAAVWMLYGYTVSFGPWTGIPIYLVASAAMLIFLPASIISALVMAGALLAYELAKNLQPEYLSTVKGFAGVVVFATVLATNYQSLLAMRRLPDMKIARWLRLILVAILVSIAVDHGLGVLDLKPSPYPHYFLPIDRRSGFFVEPSFLALAISPFIFMAMFNFGLFRRYLGWSSLGLIGLIAVLCPSATVIGIGLLSGAIVVFDRTLKGRAFSMIGSALLVTILGAAIIAIPAIAERFTGVLAGDNSSLLLEQNMSSLVFIKGRQMATYAIQHFPLGVAFMNMESLQGYASVSSFSSYLYTLNSNDGSSILFKGISEFGIMFVLVSGLAAWRFLRAMSRDDGRSLFNILVLSIQFAAFAHFIRGSSFFDGLIAIGLSIFLFEILQERLRGTARRKAKARQAFARPQLRSGGRRVYPARTGSLSGPAPGRQPSRGV